MPSSSDDVAARIREQSAAYQVSRLKEQLEAARAEIELDREAKAAMRRDVYVLIDHFMAGLTPDELAALPNEVQDVVSKYAELRIVDACRSVLQEAAGVRQPGG